MEQHFLSNFSFLLRSMRLGVLVTCLYWKREKIIWHCSHFIVPGKVFREHVLVGWLSCTHSQQNSRCRLVSLPFMCKCMKMTPTLDQIFINFTVYCFEGFCLHYSFSFLALALYLLFIPHYNKTKSRLTKSCILYNPKLNNKNMQILATQSE